MRAEVGEWLIVEGAHLGDHRYKGQIIEVRGPNGEPPYLVRWLDDDHVSLLFPGPDAHREHSLPHHLKIGARIQRDTDPEVRPS
ncbi:DUF1918 domain-containing protein [Saccharopolyspora rhizosphaerae]|uniref:DUF1918 domain-containing protein n=1 Tax=Saccharopolyspora rhizosphaerae TaxID=2492662 RepID=A0A3R8QJP7_9PSEU|nr:DUF1918 domain-containing protein [Saccharopolyspora rhizosphaerae]RRO13966.1 DUF1918 domain-containing protein [Saccharopolyspora rhizosphaerae]